jgi:hypothetical protein
MAWVHTGHYSGPAQVLVDDNKVADATIDLRSLKRVMTTTTLAGQQPVEGGTESWEGRIVSADRDLGDLFRDLLGTVFTLRTPDGRETTAVLRDDHGTLAPSSIFPFQA